MRARNKQLKTAKLVSARNLTHVTSQEAVVFYKEYFPNLWNLVSFSKIITYFYFWHKLTRPTKRSSDPFRSHHISYSCCQLNAFCFFWSGSDAIVATCIPISQLQTPPKKRRPKKTSRALQISRKKSRHFIMYCSCSPHHPT